MKFFLFVFFLLGACTTAKKTEDSGKSVRVFYNNDNSGFLDPCGCRVSPIGGMDRRWNAMVAFPEDSRIFVDAGNLLYKSAKAADYLSPQWFEQALGVIEGYNILHADAVAVGENEFALGVKKFLEITKKAKFPFLSANLYWKNKNELLVKDSLMLERQGRKIGIFALFHPSLNLPDELEARDPLEAAKQMVKKLKSQGAEMVILLSHQGYDEDEKLAKAVSGIDLIVGAHSQSLLQSPDMVNDTLVVQLSSQGQMLGMVEYDASNLRRKDFVVAELNAEYDNPPHGMANPIKNLVAVTNLKMAEANRRLDQRTWASKQGKLPSFETFITCRECHAEQARFQETKLHAASFLTLLHKKQESNLDCVKCHSVGLGKPNGFKTIREAFLDEKNQPIPLEKIKAALGPDFINSNTSYRADPAKVHPDVARWLASLKKVGVKKSFVTVQCENCHGLMPGHPFDETIKPAKVVASTCFQCHTKEQMPAWYDATGAVKQETVSEALKSITCPK